MVKSLEGHVAVVTGAAKGIGKATAQILADRGAAVACWDIQEEGLKRTAEEINASGGKTFGFMVDVTESSQVQQAVKQTVDALGVIDILVNNAGGTMDVPPGIDDLTEEGWDKVVSLNMRGPFLTCKAVVGMMKEKGWGRIINIASGAGRSHSRSGVIPYAAGKAGLLGFTRQLAVELAPHGINVNSVSPGLIDTHGYWAKWSSERKHDTLITIANERVGQAEEVAGVVAFMASDDSSYIVGQCLSVDGGHWMF
ncbi:MAG: SDR family NAD(P)-dependent oxidoreductase [Chloroflexi bacterium]|nr:SDR family NAD(P)-dependent oxidoreductase [Chloroflexota bacterium]